MNGSASGNTGIGRSLDIYCRDGERTRRMDALNARFVPKGGLAFDIGAHVGDRTASFARLGASVITVEPQPRVFRALRLLHPRVPDAVLLNAAVGRAEGEITLHLNRRNPTVATVQTGFIAAAQGAEGWQDQVWDDCVTVPVTTLDALIAQHGTPDFIKIDVEGHEAEVLAGLSTPIKALSFEMTTIQRDVAHACINRMQQLGAYEFNLSLGEAHALQPGWSSADKMHAVLDALPASANSGDVYARLAS